MVKSRKWLALLLAGVMAFGLSACGAKPAEPEAAASAAEEAASEAEEAASEAEEEAAADV